MRDIYHALGIPSIHEGYPPMQGGYLPKMRDKSSGKIFSTPMYLLRARMKTAINVQRILCNSYFSEQMLRLGKHRLVSHTIPGNANLFIFIF